MNRGFIFLCLSLSILVLSLIVICIAPIINNFEIKQMNWSFSRWRNLNCQIFSDREELDNISLDEIQKLKIKKKLCYRRKGIHDLEYTALIIVLIIGIVCSNLSLFLYFSISKTLAKKAGIIGLITGIIGFIITFVYVCFSGYIFDNDPAFVEIDYFTSSIQLYGGITKLYPNGARYKVDGSNLINVYDNDKSYFSQYVKFKELGQKQYNYNKKFYETYYSDNADCINPASITNCEYIYFEPPNTYYEYKDLHDRWLATLILSVFIFICNAGLAIFGFLMFKKGADSNEENTVVIS